MRPIHVVVSLGTGKIPVKPIKAVDVYRPSGVLDLPQIMVGASALKELLIDQVGDAMASCSVIADIVGVCVCVCTLHAHVHACELDSTQTERELLKCKSNGDVLYCDPWRIWMC